MQIKDAPALTTLAFSTSTTLSQLTAYIRTVARQLYREAARLDLEVTGPIIWQYEGSDGQLDTIFQLDIALPIQSAQGEPAEGVTFKPLEPIRGVSAEHSGDWANLSATYGTLIGEVVQKGYQPGTRCREVYVTVDFENPANNLTLIYLQIL